MTWERQRNGIIDHGVVDISLSEDDGADTALPQEVNIHVKIMGRPNHRLDGLGKEYIDDNR